MKKEKIYVRYAERRTNILDMTTPKGAIYGRYSENGKQIFWFCDYFKVDKNGNLPVYINISGEWSADLVNANHPIYKWVKYAVNWLGFIPVIERKSVYNAKPSDLMRTYSLHKKGNGSRINTHQINQQLRWREVTEVAHWYGKGNASVVANSIK